jgi:hypothetical protein
MNVLESDLSNYNKEFDLNIICETNKESGPDDLMDLNWLMKD